VNNVSRETIGGLLNKIAHSDTICLVRYKSTAPLPEKKDFERFSFKHSVVSSRKEGY